MEKFTKNISNIPLTYTDDLEAYAIQGLFDDENEWAFFYEIFHENRWDGERYLCSENDDKHTNIDRLYIDYINGKYFLSYCYGNYGESCTNIYSLRSNEGTAVREIPAIGKSVSFPNPVKQGEPMTVRFRSVAARNSVLAVYSMDGTELYSSPVDAGENSHSIDTAEFPAGMYVYTLRVGPKTREEGKFIVR